MIKERKTLRLFKNASLRKKQSQNQDQNIKLPHTVRQNTNDLSKLEKIKSYSKPSIEVNQKFTLAPIKSDYFAVYNPEEKSKSKTIDYYKEKQLKYQNSNQGQYTINRLLEKINETNLNFHNQYICVCEHCTCGRHLCKMHPFKPNLNLTSIYKNDFKNQQSKYNNTIELRPKSKNRHKKKYIVSNSTYQKDYHNRQYTSPQRLHPTDNLAFKGPVSNLTSYQTGIPGYHGDNPFVKPNYNIYEGNLPFYGNTIYRQSYLPTNAKLTQLAKQEDHFSKNGIWINDSNYRDTFKSPDKKHYKKSSPLKFKPMQYLKEDFKQRFQTNYKKEYMEKQIHHCLAKHILESKIKEYGESFKINLRQNTNFKQINPEYHAISTSKYQFVS